MSNCTLTKRLVFTLGAFAVISLLGCSGSATGLPESVTVALPDGTQAEATLGAGVLALADTTWEFTRVYAGGTLGGTPFIRVTFGPEGELTSFEDNTIATELFGDTILFDGAMHATSQEGVSYTAGTFGAATSDATGFAFVGEINAFAAVLGKVATATVTARGEFDADDPNIMSGTFMFEGEVLVEVPGVPADSFADQFDYVARRVE